MKKTIKRIFNKLGYKISKIKKSEYPIDYNEEFIREYQEIESYTMTSIERVFALKSAVKYTVDNNIQGSYVE